MGPSVEYAQARSTDFSDHILDRYEIPERFVHLLSLDTQQASMKPITCQRLLPSQALSLRDLRLMMRKNELSTATMNIIRRPKIRQGNRGVLDVPAWPSLSPRTVPEYPARLLALPQRKIPRMLFPRITIHPVRQTLLEKSCDLIDNLRYMIRSIRVQVNAFHMQILHVLEEGLRQTFCQNERLFA